MTEARTIDPKVQSSCHKRERHGMYEADVAWDIGASGVTHAQLQGEPNTDTNVSHGDCAHIELAAR